MTRKEANKLRGKTVRYKGKFVTIQSVSPTGNYVLVGPSLSESEWVPMQRIER